MESWTPLHCKFSILLEVKKNLLDKVLEGGVEVGGTALMITEELMFQGEPNCVGDTPVFPDDLLEIAGDCAVNPGQDNAIHVCLVWEGGMTVLSRT